jgi:hypothetical protein
MTMISASASAFGQCSGLGDAGDVFQAVLPHAAHVPR